MSSTRNRHNIQLAAFYFPDYRCDERMEKEHGPGWTEWDVVQAARSRFPGHRQPKVPLWGYGDESEPEVMAKKIAAAADHGIGTFLFDWYWYGEKPFLEGALKRGFLNAPNRHRMTYALMWANHPWRNMHPHGWNEPVRTLLESDVSPRSFDRLCGILLEEHLQRPEYWTICGKPFFSIYDITRLCENFGGIPPLRKALDQFRARAERVGLAGLHLNLTSRGETILPGERKSNAPELVEELGFDSVTSYIWIHHMPLCDFPRSDYRQLRTRYLAYWDRAEREYSVPYYPNIMTAWDASPRTVQSDRFLHGEYPYDPVVENTPEQFAETLRLFRDRIALRPEEQRIITLNAWNEWTEGSYLEPDSECQYRYLEAIREIFAE